MKKINLSILILLGSVILFALQAQNNKGYNRGINITPKPLDLIEKQGYFTLTDDVVFISNNIEVDEVAQYFSAKIKKSTGYELAIVKKTTTSDYIRLQLVSKLPVNDEGYLFDSDTRGVTIKAKTLQGLFYGMQTLMQLLPAEIESDKLVLGVLWRLPAVSIKDEPRFQYRGQHLDVCRHFASVDFIKKQLDVLAMFKINKFHWHLTDDQGWRIEIKKYPKLTEIGAKRTEGEGSVYGPFFYTQEQVKEVVAYAKERFIEVIPEIELPGHGVAALTAYPEFSCTGGPFEVRNIWGVSNDVYCAGNERTYTFLTDVIEEVIPLFDSKFFHIGGDECPKGRWKSCPKCQAKIKEQGLVGDKDHSAEDKLQSYVVKCIEEILLKHGKKMIGWDEILEGGLASSATVMSWRGEKGGIKAGNMGHDVVMTPGNWLYLDHFQGDPKISPVSIGHYTPLSETYSYEPLPSDLAIDKRHHILGAQANVWTEYMYSPDIIEWRVYPRVIALAELTWTAKDQKNYADFERRMDNQRVRLDMHHINYYIPQPEQVTPSCDFVAFTDKAVLDFKTTEPVRMIYTTDGTDPVLTSSEYTKPLEFSKTTLLKIRSVLASDRMGEPRTIIIEKQQYTPASTLATTMESGIRAEYFKGIAVKASELEGRTPDEIQETIKSPQDAKYRITGARELHADDYYNTILSGYINIPIDGVYYFSSDSEELWIDNRLLISNHNEVKRYSRNDRSIALAKGLHSIRIVRLCNIVGGWPPLWDRITVLMREAGEDKFKVLDESYFFNNKAN